MSDLISRQAAIDVLEERLQANGYSNVAFVSEFNRSIGYLRQLPSAQPEQRWIPIKMRPMDAVSREKVFEYFVSLWECIGTIMDRDEWEDVCKTTANELPSAQPEQRYTEEELRVFAHGISLSLLSKRSAQHWQYDEDTATEIKFLERLYEKVGADMKGGQE